MMTRIPTRSKRQAMDWSLVLVSQGIESIVDRADDTGWGLLVSAEDHERALDSIRQYRAENIHWPWRREIGPEVLFDWGSLAWVLLIAAFFWISRRIPPLQDAGLMDAAAVSHGEWWRLFTALFLHGDLAHLAANSGIGFILVGLVMGRYGTGTGLLAAALAGVGGNCATWLVYGEHRSLGASGMVMGALGLLAAQSISLWRGNPRAWKYILTGILAGVMLFVLLGLSPGTDVLAHLGGFVSGILLAALLAPVDRIVRSTAMNLLAAALFAAATILSWYLALKS